MVVLRHGTITGFKVYRGLEKSRFQNHKKFSLYRSCGIHSFFRVAKDGKCRTPSAVCSEERKSHTAPPPPVGAMLLAVSQRDSVVCRMMAEGDELGVDRLSAPILSILPIIDIGHFKNRFADNFFFFFLCKQTYYLQVTLFIGE